MAISYYKPPAISGPSYPLLATSTLYSAHDNPTNLGLIRLVLISVFLVDVFRQQLHFVAQGKDPRIYRVDPPILAAWSLSVSKCFVGSFLQSFMMAG